VYVRLTPRARKPARRASAFGFVHGPVSPLHAARSLAGVLTFTVSCLSKSKRPIQQRSLYRADPPCQAPGPAPPSPSGLRQDGLPRRLALKEQRADPARRTDKSTSHRSALPRRLDLLSVAERTVPVNKLARKNRRPRIGRRNGGPERAAEGLLGACRPFRCNLRGALPAAL